MNKKITRRVVLGTVIDGLAVAPFVVSHFRHKEQITDKFAEEWKRLVMSVDAAIAVVPNDSIKIADGLVSTNKVDFVSLAGFYQGTAPRVMPKKTTDIVAFIPDYFMIKGNL
jgi:phosphotransacetylase